MNIGKIKDIFLEFLKNDLEEINKNKMRFFALVFFAIIAVGFMFVDDDSEQIDLNEPVQIEQEEIVSTEDKKVDKNIIVVKKNPEIEKNNISVVIGENQNDVIYVRDPFSSQDTVEVAEKIDVEEIPAMPPKIPPIQENSEVISSINPITPDNLPPIPDVNVDLLIPQDKPILPENETPAEKFILTGTLISDDNKNALIRKISSDSREKEDIVVKVGDYVQGQKITDIVGSKIILDDGANYMQLNGFESTDIIFSDENNNIEKNEDLPVENLDNGKVEDLNIDKIQDTNISLYNFKIEDTIEESENIEAVLSEDNISQEIQNDSLFIDEEIITDNIIDTQIKKATE